MKGASIVLATLERH